MSLESSLRQAARTVSRLRGRHALAVSAAVAAVLGGSGAVALAVSDEGAQINPGPARLVQETIAASAGVTAQLEALAAKPMVLHRTELSRPGDNLSTLLRRGGVLDPAAIAALRDDPTLKQLINGRSGRVVSFDLDHTGRLLGLTVRGPDSVAQDAPVLPKGAPRSLAAASRPSPTHFQRVDARREAEGWKVLVQRVPLQVAPKVASGSIRSSLFAATDAAQIPDGVAAQLIDVFSSDIDFHRELRKGDRFSLMYETFLADGEAAPWVAGEGRILAAEFQRGKDSFEAYWSPTGDGRGDYFSADGTSRRRAYLASPLAFSRVTSGFAMRFHPVLQTLRAHLGVDYGAPTGTDVMSVADGQVVFAGRQNGYGNVVEVRHDRERSTLYAHLSRIDVRVGQKVSQADVVGAVGATGMATGPHLHFEFRVLGVHQDPLTLAREARYAKLEGAAKSRFLDVVRLAEARLAAASAQGGEASSARFE